ncbi:MAG: secretin and TonB N-terminal domain-containing protein [Planctomycetota bacterium]
MSVTNVHPRKRTMIRVGLGLIALAAGAAVHHFGQRAALIPSPQSAVAEVAEVAMPMGIYAEVTGEPAEPEPSEPTSEPMPVVAAESGGMLPDLSALFDSEAIEKTLAKTLGGQGDGDAVTLPIVDPFADTEPALIEQESTPLSSEDVVFTDSYSVGDIHVTDAPVDQVLRMLAEQTQMNIIAHEGVTGNITANLYGVTVEEALDAILRSNGFEYRNAGNFVHVYTADDFAALQQSDAMTETRVFRVFHIEAVEAERLIKPVLTENAVVAVSSAPRTGISSGDGTIDTGGFNYSNDELLVITDNVDNLDNVRRLLDDIDRRPAQILIEATILRATLSEDNALGVDFNVLGGVDFTEVTLGGGQVLAGASDALVSPDAASIGTGQSFSSPAAGGLRFGLVTGDVSVFINALEGVTDTAILANPKVLALNKQEGRVLVGRRDGFLTTTVTETSTVQSVDFLETGTRLVFRPYITDDGFVRLEVRPEDSNGGVNAANLPFEETTEVSTNVIVKDGHTIVIGGLFREFSSTARRQVPGLGNVPGVGSLFRSQSDSTIREEIVILLTPHIIKDNDEYAARSAEELATAERLRIGVREGMMPWGRERLAEGFYESALRELRKEDADERKAIFDLNAAIHLNPKFLEAIELREELTGRAVSAVDNSSIRTFLRDHLMRETRVEALLNDRPRPREFVVGETKLPTSRPAEPMFANKEEEPEPESATESEWDALLESIADVDPSETITE